MKGPRVVEKVRVRWPWSLITSTPPMTGKQRWSSHMNGVRSITRTRPSANCAAALTSKSGLSASRRWRAHRVPGLR